MNIRKTPILVSSIKQKDNHTFSIVWSDGAVKDYRLSELQKRCPCANCVDESTGKRILNDANVNADVRAVKIVSIGRYALRIQFTSGCSTGIYGYDMLYQL